MGLMFCQSKEEIDPCYLLLKQLTSIRKASLLMAAATSGIVATTQVAVIYDEDFGGSDLADTAGTATVLTSGTDTVAGTLHDTTDRNDHFIISSLAPGGLATFDWNYAKEDGQLQVGFTFSDPAGGTLHTTGFLSTNINNGSTPSLTVPASGQILVSVQNQFTAEAGGPSTSWGVATADVVPEPSSSALVALGSLLALRRRR